MRKRALRCSGLGLALLLLTLPSRAVACVVGAGTGASCTESALTACLPGGGSSDGTVTFKCGGAATITVTSAKTISADTNVDGGSLITISGGNILSVFSVNTGVKFTVQNLTIANGYNSAFPGGGGVYNNGGMLTVTNSTFSGNAIALQSGSPAINARDESVCSAAPVNSLDQRGFVRPGKGATNCSIGAYEYNSPGALCVGDCDGDGHVTVDEILTMVNIALGNTSVTACEAGDANHDGQITVDEILTAVNNALNGCPPEVATATPTPTSTLTVTQSATATISLTPAAIATITPTPTHTAISTATLTTTSTQTATVTPTITATPTHTATNTPPNTVVVTPPPTQTPTDTATVTATATGTPTTSATVTPTNVSSPSPTHTATPSPTSTEPAAPTATPTDTASPSPTPSQTPFCFAAGTLVQTSGGPVPIEEIRAGDVVLSFDVLTGQTSYRPVLELERRRTMGLIVLSLSGGDSILVSPEHYFWVKGSGWVRAQDLTSGDSLLTPYGSGQMVVSGESVSTGTADTGIDVFNLVVAEFDTYFVGSGPVLVHSCDYMSFSSVSVDALPD